jgi:hypothetical protein
MTRSALFGLACLVAAGPALAEQEVTACQTVDGHTSCVHHSGPGNLSCRTVDGRTRCTEVPDPQLGTPLPDPDEADGPVVVERRDGRLHVRAGGVDVELPE